MCIRDRAKRDGVTTLPDLLERHALAEIVGYLGRSLGIEGATTAREMVAKYDPQRIPREPWVFDF